MPSKSAKQHRLMEAVAHDPKFAKKVGIDQKVGREFVAADKRKKAHMGNPANRMDIALFKGANGDMAISKDAMKDVMKHMASKGRDGDTELVHVNKAEEEMLKAHGGRGSVNPATGLKEYPPGKVGGTSPSGNPTGSTNTGGGVGGGKSMASRGNVSAQKAQGTTKATSGSSKGSATNDVISRTLGGLLDTAGTRLTSEKKSTIGGALAADALSIGGAAVAGPLGALIGGLVGKMIKDPINEAINSPRADMRSPDPNSGISMGRVDKGKTSSNVSLGPRGGGRHQGSDTVPLKPKTGTTADVSIPPGANTPSEEPTKDYIDLLLERFKFPYFEPPPMKTIDTTKHSELINSVIGSR